MSTILLNKKHFQKLLKEAAPVSGDDTAKSVAKAEIGLEKAKKRLQNLNIYEIPELEPINTIDQLSIEPFKFTFLLQVKDNPEELTLPTPYQFDTLARVVDKSPLTLEVKWLKNGIIFPMIFTEEQELITQLPGTKDPNKLMKLLGRKSNKVMALVSEGNKKDGKFYTVSFGNAEKVIKTAKNEQENGEGEEGDKEGKGGKGTEGTEGGSEGKVGKVSKEQLFNDLAGFFKFTYNNRKMAAPEMFGESIQSYVDQIAESILIKEDDDDRVPSEIEEANGKIYVKTITLGPKAKERKQEDGRSYQSKMGGGQSSWDGNLKTLTVQPVSVQNISLKITDTTTNPTAVQQVEGVLGAAVYNNTATVRKSKKFDNNNNRTIVIELPNNKGAIVCKIPSDKDRLRDKIDVEVSKKPAGNDNITNPIAATLQITV